VAGSAIDVADASGGNLLTFAHDGWVDHLALSPEGQYLAAGLADPVSSGKNRVVIWNLANGEMVSRYARPGESGPLAFLQDGQHLVFSDGRRLRIVNWRIEDVISQACARLNRNFSCSEWRTWLQDESYRPTCSELPSSKCDI
jgi:WD40 repeat protein